MKQKELVFETTKKVSIWKELDRIHNEFQSWIKEPVKAEYGWWDKKEAKK